MTPATDPTPDRRPTKLPAQRVPSDNYAIVRDGATYQPHAGEWVEFAGDASVADMLLMQRMLRGSRELAALAALDADPEQQFERFGPYADTIVDLCARLARVIVAWSWTDAAGRPLPNPPTAADLAELDMAELGYLLRRGQVTDPNPAGAGSTRSSAASAAPQPNRATRRRRG